MCIFSCPHHQENRMNKIILMTVLIGQVLSSQALTINEAFEMAVENSPELRAVRFEQQAAFREAAICIVVILHVRGL